MQEGPDIKTLHREALNSVYKLLNGMQLDAQEILRLGMFLGTISRYMPVLEQAEQAEKPKPYPYKNWYEEDVAHGFSTD